MKYTILLLPAFLLLLSSCGKPPSAGGGPPEGDFPADVVGAPVTVEPLRESIQLVGSLQAPELITVLSEVQAEVLELPAAEGSRVEKGQLLVSLDDRKIKARLVDARSRLQLAESTSKRAESLRASSSISEQELDEARAAVDQARAAADLLETDLEDTRIHAAMDGVLGEHQVSPGQVVQPGQALMEVVMMDPLEISFDVPERFLSTLRNGLKVKIRSDAYGDRVFEGEVSYLAPRLRPSTRTLPVKARVKNPEGLLRPGMFGQVELVLNENEDAMFVPESAVIQNGIRSQVIVRNQAYRSEFRDVKTGVRQGGRIQILEGISPEDMVVAEGTIKVFFPGMLLNFTKDSERYGIEASMAPVPETPATPEAPEAEGE